ncbi:unnamed protein product [Colias eurytheme]|nr:unnamed protein product [Colias eurytheme]
MESSDESFAWTDASNHNNDSSDNNDILKGIDKMKHNKSEEEFNSSYSNEEKHVEQKHSKKAKKRKNSIENNAESPKKKRIKTEPVSDVDAKSSETKIKQELDLGRAGDSDTSFNDTYLNLRVKEEHASDHIKQKKAKKNKKKKSSVNSDTDESKVKVDKEHEFEEDSRQSLILEDKITVEETVVTKPENYHSVDDESYIKPKKKKKKRKQICDDNDISEIQTSLNNGTNFNEEVEYNGVQPDHSIVEIGSADESIQNSHDFGKSKENPKISDRIKFEDDTTEIEFNNHNDSTIIEENMAAPSKQMKRYIIENPNLQKLNIKIGNKKFFVTEMDEVWLFKCPRDVELAHLSGIKLDVSSKSKVKINGKNYDTTVDDNICRLPILSYTAEHRAIIRNVKLNGCINLKKRLPKTHPLENEIMENDQMSFIPLPETKCRHPFFGVHYKKSIKIPAKTAERLKENPETHDDVDEVRKKKKKHKKEKRLEVDMEPPEVETVEAVAIRKKKKASKRKHSEVDESPPPKKKRLKHNPEASAETWESEQAIEETLFNF